MDTDDIEPLSKPQELKDLEVMSIEALNTYIEKLKTEIERAEAQIASKKSHRNTANSFFGKKIAHESFMKIEVFITLQFSLVVMVKPKNCKWQTLPHAIIFKN